MKTAAAIAFFLTHEASVMQRDAMVDLFNAEFPDYVGDDEFHKGLRAGVAILQQEAAQKGEVLDVRGAFARLSKISRYEVGGEIVEYLAEFPTGISTALH